jgi:hypothetical protein
VYKLFPINKEVMMKALLSVLVLSLVVVLSAGCSTMQPPRYSIFVDNIQELKNYTDAQVQVSA